MVNKFLMNSGELIPLRSMVPEEKRSFLEAYFFSNYTYSVRIAQVVQRSLFVEGACLFCVGGVLIPFFPQAQSHLAGMMLFGITTSAAGSLLNYIFYNRVYKPHDPETHFNLFYGPIESSSSIKRESV